MSGAPSDFGPTRMFYTASPGNQARRLAARKRIKAEPRKRIHKPKVAAKTKPPRITKKEQVAELLSEGKEIKEIADHMNISIKAVHRHLEKIKNELGL